MVLQNFDAVTSPYLVPRDNASSLLFALSAGTNTSIGSAISLVSVGGWNACQVGDKLLLQIIYNNTGDTMTSVVQAGTAAVSGWTRLTVLSIGSRTMEIWTTTVTAAGTFLSPSVTIGTATAWGFSFYMVRDASSIALGNTNTSTNPSSLTLASPVTTRQNDSVMFFNGHVNALPGLTVFKTHTSTPGFVLATGGSVSATDATPSEFLSAGGVLCIADAVNTSTTFKYVKTSGTTQSVMIVALFLHGSDVQLDDNSFLLGEGGVLLNDPNLTVVPFYDVDTVQGLDDLTIDSDVSSIDGQDGSYVQGKFKTGKTVIIDGTVYSGSPFDQSLIDNVKRSLITSDLGFPLIYKPSGKSPRYLQVKPLSFKCDIARVRSAGQAPYEIQVASEDAYAYENDDAYYSTYLGTPLYPLTGSIISYVDILPPSSVADDILPRIYFDYDDTYDDTTMKFEFFSPTWINTRKPYQFDYQTSPLITINETEAAGAFSSSFYLDLRERALYGWFNNAWIDCSSFITVRRWFSIIPGINNRIYMSRPSTSTKTDGGFAVVYGAPWR
jgi:hypothetical protein